MIVTSWEQTPDGNAFALLSAQPLPEGACAMDATGQEVGNIVPDPNLLVVEVWAESDYLDGIDAAEPGAVLWREAYE